MKQENNILITVISSGRANKIPNSYNKDWTFIVGTGEKEAYEKQGFINVIEGGRLSIPEYDIKLEIADDTLVIFNGQEILHGVTPIKKTHPKGYRYTVVYYSMEQMWKCDSLNEETDRIRKKKKEREFKRLN